MLSQHTPRLAVPTLRKSKKRFRLDISKTGHALLEGVFKLAVVECGSEIQESFLY